MLSWETLTSNRWSPSPRQGHTSAYEETERQRSVYVFGGIGVGMLSELARLDLKHMRWERVPLVPTSKAVQPIAPRAFHASAVVDGYMYIFGGAGERPGQVLGDTWEIHLETGRLVSITAADGAPPVRRGHSASAGLGGLVFVLGGSRSLDPADLYTGDEVAYVFSARERRWRDARWLLDGARASEDVHGVGAGAGLLERHAHSASIISPERVLLFGGCTARGGLDGDNASVVLHLRTGDCRVLACTGAPPPPRHSHAAAVVGSYLVISGGKTTARVFSDIHLLEPSRQEWSRPALTRGPAELGARYGHAAVGAADRVVVFGGVDGAGVFAPNGMSFLFGPALSVSAERTVVRKAGSARNTAPPFPALRDGPPRGAARDAAAETAASLHAAGRTAGAADGRSGSARSKRGGGGGGGGGGGVRISGDRPQTLLLGGEEEEEGERGFLLDEPEYDPFAQPEHGSAHASRRSSGAAPSAAAAAELASLRSRVHALEGACALGARAAAGVREWAARLGEVHARTSARTDALLGACSDSLGAARSVQLILGDGGIVSSLQFELFVEQLRDTCASERLTRRAAHAIEALLEASAREWGEQSAELLDALEPAADHAAATLPWASNEGERASAHAGAATAELGAIAAELARAMAAAGMGGEHAAAEAAEWAEPLPPAEAHAPEAAAVTSAAAAGGGGGASAAARAGAGAGGAAAMLEGATAAAAIAELKLALVDARADRDGVLSELAIAHEQLALREEEATHLRATSASLLRTHEATQTRIGAAADALGALGLWRRGARELAEEMAAYAGPGLERDAAANARGWASRAAELVRAASIADQAEAVAARAFAAASDGAGDDDDSGGESDGSGGELGGMLDAAADDASAALLLRVARSLRASGLRAAAHDAAAAELHSRLAQPRTQQPLLAHVLARQQQLEGELLDARAALRAARWAGAAEGEGSAIAGVAEHSSALDGSTLSAAPPAPQPPQPPPPPPQSSSEVLLRAAAVLVELEERVVAAGHGGRGGAAGGQNGSGRGGRASPARRGRGRAQPSPGRRAAPASASGASAAPPEPPPRSLELLRAARGAMEAALTDAELIQAVDAAAAGVAPDGSQLDSEGAGALAHTLLRRAWKLAARASAAVGGAPDALASAEGGAPASAWDPEVAAVADGNAAVATLARHASRTRSSPQHRNARARAAGAADAGSEAAGSPGANRARSRSRRGAKGARAAAEEEEDDAMSAREVRRLREELAKAKAAKEQLAASHASLRSMYKEEAWKLRRIQTDHAEADALTLHISGLEHRLQEQREKQAQRCRLLMRSHLQRATHMRREAERLRTQRLALVQHSRLSEAGSGAEGGAEGGDGRGARDAPRGTAPVAEPSAGADAASEPAAARPQLGVTVHRAAADAEGDGGADSAPGSPRLPFAPRSPALSLSPWPSPQLGPRADKLDSGADGAERDGSVGAPRQRRDFASASLLLRHTFKRHTFAANAFRRPLGLVDDDEEEDDDDGSSAAAAER